MRMHDSRDVCGLSVLSYSSARRVLLTAGSDRSVRCWVHPGSNVVKTQLEKSDANTSSAAADPTQAEAASKMEQSNDEVMIKTEHVDEQAAIHANQEPPVKTEQVDGQAALSSSEPAPTDNGSTDTPTESLEVKMEPTSDAAAEHEDAPEAMDVKEETVSSEP